MASNVTDVSPPVDANLLAASNSALKFTAPTEWQNAELGVRKKRLSLHWHSIDHPTELSECLVRFDDVRGLDDRESDYLRSVEAERLIQIGNAITGIDFLIDIVLQQMYTGETSRIEIDTRNGSQIAFTATLLKILSARYLYQLSAKEMCEWALARKTHGVAMFKKWPSMAQRYFNQAAKGLISHKPFDAAKHGIAGHELQDMLDAICLNIAACLLKEKRYDDVLHVLADEATAGDGNDGPSRRTVSEKAVYRRALAHFHLNQLDEARTQLERVNYAQNRDQHALWKTIVQQQSEYQTNYAQMVRKMFK